jgi:hypothetical protein
VRVKARAVIWIDGKLIVAEQRRRGRQDVSLIFLAEARGVPNLGRLRALNLDDCAHRSDVRPPILSEIAHDHALGWRENPRWLGNLAHPRRRDTRTVAILNAAAARVDPDVTE